ncbi:MAG: Holliday junction resolvase RuvX [Candidatus Dormibacteraeota bacterium]|nr:Holliday junction resolvase RuvX [Candidatus Dormibacteraeota bacterium]
MGRVLAVDPGSRRVGVALSDPQGIIAQPLTAVPAEPLESLPERLVELARKHGAGELVVGLPRRMDGGLGPEAQGARALGDRLRRLSGLRVTMVDERLTSAAAERSLLATRARRERRKQLSDQVAASLILQTYLDRRRGPGKKP